MLAKILRAAAELQEYCVSEKWSFCFIGGLAVQRWGEPRLTQDADLTLLTGFGREEAFIDALLLRFRPRRPDARDFAIATRVLLIENEDSVPLDVALGAMPFEERSVQRSSNFRFQEHCSLLTCSAEDLLVHKCFANRVKDWLDVEGILFRQRLGVDFTIVFSELEPLVQLKEEPEITPKLRKLIDEVKRKLDLVRD